jgi:predicted dehydrogenase
LQNGLVRFCHSLFDFPNSNVAIASTMGIIDQQGRPFTHGFEIQMRDATLHFEFASLKSGPQQMPLKIITADGEVSLIETGNADPVEAFVAEIDAVVECLRTGCLLNQLSGEYGAEAIAICDAEWQSVRSKQRVPVRL